MDESKQERLIDSAIHEQTQAKKVCICFISLIFVQFINIMCVRKHGPLRLSQGTQYQCLRCINDKEQPKKFSKENNMIPLRT